MVDEDIFIYFCISVILTTGLSVLILTIFHNQPAVQLSGIYVAKSFIVIGSFIAYEMIAPFLHFLSVQSDLFLLFLYFLAEIGLLWIIVRLFEPLRRMGEHKLPRIMPVLDIFRWGSILVLITLLYLMNSLSGNYLLGWWIIGMVVFYPVILALAIVAYGLAGQRKIQRG